MSEDKKFKMGDDLIAVVRELVQLSILTGTNIVDHLRAIEIEQDDETGKLIPTVEYVEAYNEMVEELMKKAEAAAEAFEKSQPTELEFPTEESDSDLN